MKPFFASVYVICAHGVVVNSAFLPVLSRGLDKINLCKVLRGLHVVRVNMSLLPLVAFVPSSRL